MKHKIEAIDFLRGLSIISIIAIHVLAWHDSSVITDYTQIPFLFDLRNWLQFSVVTLVLCSGFSLFASHKNIKLKPKVLWEFYKARFARLLYPWWTFLIIFFGVHWILNSIGIEWLTLDLNYVMSSFFLLGGVGFGWLILLMMLLSFIFPFLAHWYRTHDPKKLFGIFALLYLASMILFWMYPYEVAYDKGFSFKVFVLLPAFLFGWSLVYLVSFTLERFYNAHPAVKKELQLTFSFVFLFILVNGIYKGFGFTHALYLVKYPPSPFYLAWGLMLTYIFITLVFSYKHFLHVHFKKALNFLSHNAYWLFMWNALTLSLITPLLLRWNFGSIFVRLAIDFVLNFALCCLLVYLQKKFVQLEMHVEKHHF